MTRPSLRVRARGLAQLEQGARDALLHPLDGEAADLLGRAAQADAHVVDDGEREDRVAGDKGQAVIAVDDEQACTSSMACAVPG